MPQILLGLTWGHTTIQFGNLLHQEFINFFKNLPNFIKKKN